MSTRKRNSSDTSADVSESLEPLVISEGKHPIRIKDIDKEALKILYRLRDAGYSGYLVGGGVRDLYLGKRPKDFDISTDARPGQLRKLFRNSRTIGRRFRLVQVFFRGGKIVEVSTLRSQSEYDINGSNEVLPSNNTFGTTAEDAFRRDLTINSLFYEIENNTIIDYVGGVKDLDDGIIRIVGEPDRRVLRDPVRMMRAIRHAARNNFSIDPKTWDSIVDNREKLELCPTSRIRDEILKDLSGGASEPWVKLILKGRLFSILFPFYNEMASGPGRGEFENSLFSLLGVVDRLYKTGAEKNTRIGIPDYFLMAVFLLPWAESRFGLMENSLKGAEHYRMSRKIRTELNEILGERYNFKRMAKESMTSIFVNLGTLNHFSSRKSWPNWLKKKSYFRDSYRFFQIVREAKGGPVTDVNLFRGRPEKSGGANYAPRSQKTGGGGKGSSRGRKGFRPAFTGQKKGVFGLRGK